VFLLPGVLYPVSAYFASDFLKNFNDESAIIQEALAILILPHYCKSRQPEPEVEKTVIPATETVENSCYLLLYCQ